MKKYIVTGFDESYFKYGAAWLASLKKFANYDGEVFVVGYNLSKTTENKIIESGAKLILAEQTDEFREKTLWHILKISEYVEDGVLAYWDADTYFQSDISEVFNLAKDFIVGTSNPGFLAATAKRWKAIYTINKFRKLVYSDLELHVILTKYFSHSILKIIDDSWNFIDIPKLKEIDGVLQSKEVIPKAIHLSSNIKSILANRNILFWERYPDLHKEIFETKKSYKRKLVLNNKDV
jgi:hypothetical protein